MRRCRGPYFNRTVLKRNNDPPHGTDLSMTLVPESKTIPVPVICVSFSKPKDCLTPASPLVGVRWRHRREHDEEDKDLPGDS